MAALQRVGKSPSLARTSGRRSGNSAARRRPPGRRRRRGSTSTERGPPRSSFGRECLANRVSCLPIPEPAPARQFPRRRDQRQGSKCPRLLSGGAQPADSPVAPILRTRDRVDTRGRRHERVVKVHRGGSAPLHTASCMVCSCVLSHSFRVRRPVGDVAVYGFIARSRARYDCLRKGNGSLTL